MTDNDLEGEIVDPMPVIDNSKLKQYIQENLAKRIAMKKVIEHEPDNSFSCNEQTMGRLQQGGFKRGELILISGINSNADIPMRVSNLADDMVVLVNNHLVDPTAVHRIGLGDIVHIEKDIKANDKVLLKYQTFGGESPRLFQSKIDSTRGKVGAAIARRRKKAMRKLHKRKH